MLVEEELVVSLNFVEFDCSSQGDGDSRDLMESKFIRMYCFEGGNCGAGDGVDMGVKSRYNYSSHVRIVEVRTVGYIRLGEQALDRTQVHAIDVGCDHVRCYEEGCMMYDRLNLYFQLGGERVALDKNSSSRCV